MVCMTIALGQATLDASDPYTFCERVIDIGQQDPPAKGYLTTINSKRQIPALTVASRDALG